MRRRHAAYYSRAGTYSRSYNAEIAEANGRRPRTRAAQRLGLSLAAFDAGCQAAGYHPSEWHHVGKYASEVYYYDCEILDSDPAFWRGAANAYKSKKKRAEMLQAADRVARAAKAARIEAFRQLLIARRDCSRHVIIHCSRHNWRKLAHRKFAAAGLCLSGELAVRPGDFAGLESRIAERKAELARKAAADAAWAAAAEAEAAPLVLLLSGNFARVRDKYSREVFRGFGRTILIHGSQVNIYGDKDSMNLTISRATRIIADLIGTAES